MRADRTVALINTVRGDLAALFDSRVDQISVSQYRAEVNAAFAGGDLGVNVATLVALLRNLDVEADYPGLVVDELLGRELAGAPAGDQPLRMLGEATFHYADVHVHEGKADVDDLDAALAAGFQTRSGVGLDGGEEPVPRGTACP